MKIDIDLNDVIAVVIRKVMDYNNIQLNSEEVEKMISYIMNDKEFLEAMKSLGK